MTKVDDIATIYILLISLSLFYFLFKRGGPGGCQKKIGRRSGLGPSLAVHKHFFLFYDAICIYKRHP